MIRTVYLFEADSALTSEEDVLRAQNAMFNEVAENGNIVAVTYNQLIDSEHFLRLYETKKTKKKKKRFFRRKKAVMEIETETEAETESFFMKLFDSHSLVTVDFRIEHDDGIVEIINPARYLVRSLNGAMKRKREGNGGYIFSSLPVDKIPEEFVDRLTEYTNNQKVMEKDTLENVFDVVWEDEAVKNKLWKIVNLAKKLSNDEKYVQCNFKNKAYRNFENYSSLMHVLINTILPHIEVVSDSDIAELKEIEEIITEEKKIDKKLSVNSRTVWYEKQIGLEKYKEESPEAVKTSVARAVIDLCYNYIVEDSVPDVSKHYHIEGAVTREETDLEKLKDFTVDFSNRLKIKLGFKKGENKEIVKIGEKEWFCCAAIGEFKAKDKREKIIAGNSKTVHATVYENGYDAEQKKWKHTCILRFIKSLLKSLSYLLVIAAFLLIVDFSFSLLSIDSWGIPEWLLVVINIILVFGSDILASLTVERHKGTIEHSCDAWRAGRNLAITLRGKYDSYKRN